MLVNGYLAEKVTPSENNIIALVATTLLVIIMFVSGILFLTNPDDKAVNPSTASVVETTGVNR